MGQPCQKHPTTNTQRRRLGHTMSALIRRWDSGLQSFLNRKPDLCSALRRRTSGSVSWLRVLCIVLRTRSEDALGARFRMELTSLKTEYTRTVFRNVIWQIVFIVFASGSDPGI